MKTQKRQFKVEETDTGKRLDIFLSEQMELSRSQVSRFIDDEEVTVNGKLPKKAGDKVKFEDSIVFEPKEKVEIVQEVPIFDLDIEILKETDDYIVFNKPSGLLVHETEAQEPYTLANWIIQKYPSINGVGEAKNRPGIVHRLDKEASGALIVAKNQKMFEALKEQFKQRTIEKEYRVLVHGIIEADEGKIDFAIDRGTEGKMVSRPRLDPLKLESVSVAQPGKEALTEFWVLQRFINYTLLSVKIHTGRTHQIRVHFYAYNHPVVGDQLYFQRRLAKFNKDIKRIFLHAYRLKFTDLQGEKVEVTCPLPPDLESFLEKIK